MLIIGSYALNYHYPDFTRKPKDLDYVGNENILIINDILSSNDFSRVENLDNPIILKYQSTGIINPKLLLSLKISHLFWDINWYKHMYDVQFLIDKGNRYDLNIINDLIPFWTEKHAKIRRSNLVQTKEEFFTNGINEGVDEHDYLHTLLNPRPMYTRMLKDGSEVELDFDKWELFSYEEKCGVVFEETAVMAYERYKKDHYRNAFRTQLKDNIIKHFPQPIALFAIEHYKFLEKPKYNYREKINNQLWK